MQNTQQLTARQTEIVTAARQWIGTPYHHQAAVMGAGCDCLGLIRGVYAQVMGREAETPPPYSRDWAEASSEELLLAACGRHLRDVPPWEDMAPGDVVVLRMHKNAAAKHAAIYTGNGTMVHAQEGCPVSEVPLRVWRRDILRIFVYRFPERG
jgi:NlpC/P60 family putative phage cell wall peptidase